MNLFFTKNIRGRLTLKNIFLIFLSFSSILLLYEYFVYSNSVYFGIFNLSEKLNYINRINMPHLHSNFVNFYYSARESWSTSNLGSILFKNVPRENFLHKRENKTFVVLIWKYWKWLQARHVYSFNKSGQNDPLSQCSVKNCIFSGNNTLLESADAVVIHIQRGYFPNAKNRKNYQRWIFLNDESPKNAFSMSKNRPKLSDLANMFNWSMTYRSDADIPVPYGRTVPLARPMIPFEVDNLPQVIPNWSSKRRDVLAAVLISNCNVSYRMKYLNELKKHLSIDVHGRCSDNNKDSCPGHFRSDCELMSQYLFYIVLENSMCKEYLSEKSFYNAYSKGAIPIVMGPSLEDCEKILPPNSFLHVENFETPLDLANEIMRIGADYEDLLFFHVWRNNFEVINEHGYFGSRSKHYCRVCEALNFNDEKEKVYNETDLEEFLDPLKACREIKHT